MTFLPSAAGHALSPPLHGRRWGDVNGRNYNLQAGRVCRQGFERWGAGDRDCRGFGGLIRSTRKARIVSQFDE